MFEPSPSAGGISEVAFKMRPGNAGRAAQSRRRRVQGQASRVVIARDRPRLAGRRIAPVVQLEPASARQVSD
jgi:hypothetical protein